MPLANLGKVKWPLLGHAVYLFATRVTSDTNLVAPKSTPGYYLTVSVGQKSIVTQLDLLLWVLHTLCWPAVSSAPRAGGCGFQATLISQQPSHIHGPTGDIAEGSGGILTSEPPPRDLPHS